MTNEYTDITVVECSRLHSEEAKVNNNENYALWKNNLQDIVHLEAGDKVSVQGAMVSERGAGQPSSIEVKGQTLGFTKQYDFITRQDINACATIPTLFESIKYNASSSVIEIRDDELNFTINYYLNANGMNQISLPRRFWYTPSQTTGYQWGAADDIASGMSYFQPFLDQYFFFEDYYQILPTPVDVAANLDHFKLKNDNVRFTIMVRDQTYYTEAAADANLPAANVRDPENGIYNTYTELKSLKMGAGFNSPEYVASELTRQLQNITDETTYEFRNKFDITDYPNKPGFPIRMYNTISTETYKPFNVASAYQATGTNVVTKFDGYKNDFDLYYAGGAAPGNANGFLYLSQYGTVATKRPELYEKGRLCNRNNGDDYRGIFGTPQRGTWFSTTNELYIDQDYNETNCKRWKALFDTEDLYPEIWNTFADSRTGYTAGDTIDNSRWMHINRYQNASMSFTSDATPDGDAMLGYGGYKLHSWNGTNLKQPASAILPIYYDPTQKEIFYKCDFASGIFPEPDQYTYGCMKCDADGKIEFTGSTYNGGGSTFYNYLQSTGGDSAGEITNRKLGFDMHFSAPGMAWKLPYAGYSDRQNSYLTSVNPGNYIVHGGYQTVVNGQHTVGLYDLNSTLYKNKLYIGADVPKINWNGTNFTLSDLHTTLNVGNNNAAANPYSTSMTAVVSDNTADPNSSNPVYKINPQEQYNDWTPDRKPFTFIRHGTGTPIVSARGFNSNLQAWTIYDSLAGIFIKDINLNEIEWKGTLWDILGFSYKQFNNPVNTRLDRIDNSNLNNLSIITTNAVVSQADSKIYVQNMWGASLFTNMLPTGGTIYDGNASGSMVNYYPEIIKAATSVAIVADNLPTRMLRGYYTIRSNLLENTPFIGGQKNNTQMPVCGIVNKINGTGDFYTQPDSDLQFTVTKPLRLASLTVSIHDPDGSYARCSEQSTVLFKVQKARAVTFNVIEKLIEENKKK